MVLKLTNNASSQAAGPIAATDPTISVQSTDSEEFPVVVAGSGDWFPVTVVDNTGKREVMRCTARAANSAVLSVTRAQEGTAAQAFPNASLTKIELRLTAGAFLEVTADASRLTTGTVADARLPIRLQGVPNYITNANTLTVAGYYITNGSTVGVPAADPSGYLEMEVYSVGQYALQILYPYYDTNVRYERRQIAGNWGAWAKYDPVISQVPPGTIMDYGGTGAPAGWLQCYGQAVSRTTYAALYAIFGTRFGAGDGSSTFNLPDLRGRVAAGWDSMGGTSANRLTNPTTHTTGGINGDSLGAVGGVETHTLTEAQLASHDHTDTFAIAAGGGVHQHSVGDAVLAGSAGGAGMRAYTGVGATAFSKSGEGTHTHTISGAVGFAGSNQPHNNVQPTIILNKIVKT